MARALSQAQRPSECGPTGGTPHRWVPGSRRRLGCLGLNLHVFVCLLLDDHTGTAGIFEQKELQEARF